MPLLYFWVWTLSGAQFWCIVGVLFLGENVLTLKLQIHAWVFFLKRLCLLANYHVNVFITFARLLRVCEETLIVLASPKKVLDKMWKRKVYNSFEHIVYQLFSLRAIRATSNLKAFYNILDFILRGPLVDHLLKFSVKLLSSVNKLIQVRCIGELLNFLALSKVLVYGS